MSKPPRKQQYMRMSDGEVMEAAVRSGACGAYDLQRTDSPLHRELRARDLNGAFQMSLGRPNRRRMYREMPTSALLEYAILVAREGRYSQLTDYCADRPLYDELRARSLTRSLSETLEFARRGRRSKARAQPLSNRTRSMISLYLRASDDELFRIIKATGCSTSRGLIDAGHSVLYSVLLRRPGLRLRLCQLGWRRPDRDWASMTRDEWLSLCAEFDSQSAFQASYTAAYAAVLRTPWWSYIKKTMSDSGAWTALYGLDGIRYDSKAELIFANALHVSGIAYESHPLLPWADSRRSRAADFKVVTDLYFEVFMISRAGLARRDDLPEWLLDYVAGRENKLERAVQHSIAIVAIEAEILRYDGYQAYLQHIEEVCAERGLRLSRLHDRRLDISSTARGTNWGVPEFVQYASRLGLVKLSDFLMKGHQDLYAILADRNMRDDVRKALDEANGRATEAAGKFLLPMEIVLKWCVANAIRSRKKYDLAWRERRTPFGAPCSIRQSYGVNFEKFISGRERDDFWCYRRARKFVRRQKFVSKEAFYRAVRSEPEMRYIRKSPSAPSGGYSEFTNWPDFLGKVTSPPIH